MPTPALFVAGAGLPLRRKDALARRSRFAAPASGRPSTVPARRVARMTAAEPAEKTSPEASTPPETAEQAEDPPPQERFLPAPPTPEGSMDPSLGEQTKVVVASSASPAATKAAAAHADWLSSLLTAAFDPLEASHPFASAGAEAAVRQEPPTRRIEEWRFTDLRSVFAMRFASSPSTAAAEAATGLDAAGYVDDGAMAALVFVDGRFVPSASRYDEGKVAALLSAGGYAGGLEGYAGDMSNVASLFDRQQLSGRDPPKGANGLFASLNGALARDCAVLDVPAGFEADGPVVLLCAATGGASADAAVASAPRVAILAGANASVTVAEMHSTLGGTESVSLALGCGAITVADGAKVCHYVSTNASDASGAILHTHATVSKDARYKLVSVTVGGKLARHSVGIDLIGEGAHGDCQAAAVATDYRVVDLHSRIVHDVNNTTSNQLQKNIASGHGRTVFSGKIIVTKNGDGTDSAQLCRSLLLSQKAQVDAMPVLEIATDDVQCTHGATVSDLEPEEVFYCQARGLTATQARLLLISGFVREVLEGCPVPALEKMVGPIVERVSGEYQETKQRELEMSSI